MVFLFDKLWERIKWIKYYFFDGRKSSLREDEESTKTVKSKKIYFNKGPYYERFLKMENRNFVS